MHGFMQSCIPSVQQYWHWAPARDKLCRHATRRPRPLNLAISTTNDTARCTLAWLTWNSTRNGITIFKWLSQDTLRTQNIVFIGPVAQTQVIKPPEVVLHWALARTLGDRARARVRGIRVIRNCAIRHSTSGSQAVLPVSPICPKTVPQATPESTMRQCSKLNRFRLEWLLCCL